MDEPTDSLEQEADRLLLKAGCFDLVRDKMPQPEMARSVAFVHSCGTVAGIDGTPCLCFIPERKRTGITADDWRDNRLTPIERAIEAQ